MALSFLWSVLDMLQLVSYFSMYPVASPQNFLVFIQTISTVSLINIIPDVLSSISSRLHVDLEPLHHTFSDRLQDLPRSFATTLGKFFSPIFGALSLLCLCEILSWCCSFCNTPLLEKLKASFIYPSFYRNYLVNFLQLNIGVFLELKFNPLNGEILNSITLILSAITLIANVWFIFYSIEIVSSMNTRDGFIENEQFRGTNHLFNALSNGLKTTDTRAILMKPMNLLRQMLFAFILVFSDSNWLTLIANFSLTLLMLLMNCFILPCARRFENIKLIIFEAQFLIIHSIATYLEIVNADTNEREKYGIYMIGVLCSLLISEVLGAIAEIFRTMKSKCSKK